MKLYFCLFTCIFLLLLTSCKQTKFVQYSPLTLKAVEAEKHPTVTSPIEKIHFEVVSMASVNGLIQTAPLWTYAEPVFLSQKRVHSVVQIPHTTPADTTAPKPSRVQYNPTISNLTAALSMLLSLSSIRMSYLAAAVVPVATEGSAAALAFLIGLIAFFAGWVSLSYSRQKKGFNKVVSIIAIVLGGLAATIAAVVSYNLLVY